MSIRVDIQRDLECESLRFVATATLDGKRLHEVDEYGGPEVPRWRREDVPVGRDRWFG